MSSDMLSTQEWAQLKSWLIQAQPKATTTQWSAESWLWHWATDVSFVPIIEMAEQWGGASNWDATQWLVRWVESVDIGSGFDAANPPPSFAPGAGPCDGQSAAASGRGLDPAAASAASSSAQPPPGLGTLVRSSLTFRTGIAALALPHRCWWSAKAGFEKRGTATTALALPVPIGLSTDSPKIPEKGGASFDAQRLRGQSRLERGVLAQALA